MTDFARCRDVPELCTVCLIRMRMGDFGGVYLVRFIHLRAPYMNFFIFGNFWGSFFGVIFEFLKFSEMFLELEWVTLGGLFSEIYSFQSSIYDFWILVILGGHFFRSFLSLWNFQRCFWNENGWLWEGLYSEIYSFESPL